MVKLSSKSGKILSGVLASSTISACSASALGNSLASNSAGQQTGAGAEFISKLGKFVGNHWGKILGIVGLAGLFYYLYKQNFFKTVKLFFSGTSKDSNCNSYNLIENDVNESYVTSEQFDADFEFIKEAVKKKRNDGVYSLVPIDDKKILYIYDFSYFPDEEQAKREEDRPKYKEFIFKESKDAKKNSLLLLDIKKHQVIEKEQIGEDNFLEKGLVKLSRYREVMDKYKKALGIDRLPSEDMEGNNLNIGENILENNVLSKETVFEIEKLNEKVSYAQYDPVELVNYNGPQQADLKAILNSGLNLGSNLNPAPEISSNTDSKKPHKHKISSFDGKNGAAQCKDDYVVDRFSISDDANIVAFYRHTGGNKFYFVKEDKYYTLGKGKKEVKEFEEKAKKEGLAFKKSQDGELCLIENPKQSDSGAASAYDRFSGLITILKFHNKIGNGVNKAEKNPRAQGVYHEDNDGNFIRNALDNHYKKCGFKDPHTGKFLACNYKLSNGGKGNIIEEIVFSPEKGKEIEFSYNHKNNTWCKIERHKEMGGKWVDEWVDDNKTPFNPNDPWCKKASTALSVIRNLDPAFRQNINNNVNFNVIDFNKNDIFGNFNMPQQIMNPHLFQQNLLNNNIPIMQQANNQQQIFYDGDGNSINNFLEKDSNGRIIKSCTFKDPVTNSVLKCNYRLSNEGSVEEIKFTNKKNNGGKEVISFICGKNERGELKWVKYVDNFDKNGNHEKDGYDIEPNLNANDPWVQRMKAAVVVILNLERQQQQIAVQNNNQFKINNGNNNFNFTNNKNFN